MTDFSQLLLRGGPVALVIAVGFALKYALEGFSSWRKGRSEGSTAVVTDAATTNAMLLDSLRIEREESARRGERIDQLEAEVDDLREKLFEQRRTYEAEIGDLRSKIQEVTLQLDALQTRLHSATE